MLEIFDGALKSVQIYEKWEQMAKAQNCGALCVFSGIVRSEKSAENLNSEKLQNLDSENLVEALFFEIYEPLLKKWFCAWQARAQSQGAQILMAHSKGEVKVGELSFMCAIVSSKRAAALGLYENFIEDFKKNAPIWKYDVVAGQKIFASSRAQNIDGSGVLGL